MIIFCLTPFLIPRPRLFSLPALMCSAPDFVERMEAVRSAFANARRDSWNMFEVQPMLLQQVQTIVAASRRASLGDLAEEDTMAPLDGNRAGGDAAKSARSSRCGSAHRISVGEVDLDQLETAVDALEELAVDGVDTVDYRGDRQVHLPAAHVDDMAVDVVSSAPKRPDWITPRRVSPSPPPALVDPRV